MLKWQAWCGLATGVVLGATIVQVSAHGGDATKIHACVDRAGNIKIVGAGSSCKQNETALDWNVQGPIGLPGTQGDPGPKGDPGPPGSFTGTFTSPNQAYSLTVSDAGIELSGPAGAITLDAAGILVVSGTDIKLQSALTTDIKAGSSFVMKSSGTANVEASGVMTIKGAVVNIN